MYKPVLMLALAIFVGACTVNETQSEVEIPREGPIQLHPGNPHYFLYKGEALALITSAEHYGAVLNLDFDYRTYLKSLADEGMNYTRIFTGTYFEIHGQSFGIQNNTLAPKKDRVITPWAVADTAPSGYRIYDLDTWNEAYFERLEDFLSTAAGYDIIVEVTLFSSIYNEGHWEICPQNPVNNINISGDLNRFDAQTLENGKLLSYQESFVRKMVNELNEWDNFFFEIQNEPWSDHAVPVYNVVNKEELRANDWTYKADFADEAAMAWQDRMASVIAAEEEGLAKKHLIAQNYTNFKAPVPEVSDHISIINFHYAWPEAVQWNYHYNRVLGFDESGFAGSDDQVYRRQAWRFMLSGGGLFNSLDYSFFVGHEDGSGENRAPGGGSKTLRFQLKVLSDFLHAFDLPKLHPNQSCIKRSPGLIPCVLSDNDGNYAIFLQAIHTYRTSLQVECGHGNFSIQTLNTITGEWTDPQLLASADGILFVDVDIPGGELAMKIERE